MLLITKVYYIGILLGFLMNYFLNQIIDKNKEEKFMEFLRQNKMIQKYYDDKKYMRLK